MSALDTILIKLGLTYKEGISAEELYHAISVSWKPNGINWGLGILDITNN